MNNNGSIQAIWDRAVQQLADADEKLEALFVEAQGLQVRLQQIQREQQVTLRIKQDAQAVIKSLRPMVGDVAIISSDRSD